MEFHELLERIGVDAPATVARLGGMESILRRFILKFPQDPTFSALAHAYDIRDMKALERHVHTLKGLLLIWVSSRCASCLPNIWSRSEPLCPLVS